MINTSGVLSSSIFYCNSTYSTGDPSALDSCTDFFDLSASLPYNHSHSAYSSHHLISFPIDSNGQIGGVTVTPTSYFLVEGQAGLNEWDYWYISDSVRESNSQLSIDNGGSWSDISGTIDAHLHMFGEDVTFYYLAQACDINNLCTNSTTESDLIESIVNVPSAPDIYQPNLTAYNGIIDINYTASVPGIDRVISYYNITLLDSSENFVKIIISNNSLNLGYSWDSTSTTEGDYIIKVEACDNESLCGFGLSESFALDRSTPIITTTSPNEDNTTEFDNDGSINLVSSVTDNNDLYLIEVNITDTGLNIYSFGLYNLSGSTSYNFNENVNTTLWDNTTFVQTIRVCDSHTARNIRPIYNVKKEDNITFLDKDTILSISAKDSSDIISMYDNDRYSLRMQYDKNLLTKEYYVSSNKDITYLPHSKYKGHFVIDNMWVDFENDNDADVNIMMINKNKYKVTVYDPSDDIKFNSVGFLNCITESYEFSLIPVIPSDPSLYNSGMVSHTNWFNSDTLDTSTIPGVLMFFFILFLLISCTVASEILKIPVLTLLVGIGMVVFGLYIFAIVSSVIGAIVSIFGTLYIISSTRFY